MIGRSGNYRMAVESIRSNKWRSLLTGLGVVIGIVSVVTMVSLGEGTKRSVTDRISKSGEDIITVRPGLPDSSAGDRLIGSDFFGGMTGAGLTENDHQAIAQIKDVNFTVPFTYVTNSVSRDEKTFNGPVIGVTESLPEALGQKLSFGNFFSDDTPQRNSAVIGQRVAEQLFGENVPIGDYFYIRGKQFFVRGVFEEFDNNPLAPDASYNRAIFIQFETSKELTGRSDIYQILVGPSDPESTEGLTTAISDALKGMRSGEQDFIVQRQEDKLAAAEETLTLMTSFVAGIAAISLIVGGIGILNIMLVSVTERTHEIGIRKALGATNRQILNQFLTEAIILSMLGGVVGIILSLLVNYLLRILTNLQPVITWPIMVIAFFVSVVVGIIFGVTPAMTAARKRPIDALRHE